jgi:protoporphyrin/coproporphyrin ferrochelatase
VTSAKIGVVLFNLGGPDQISAVEPFLINLFNDPAIIRLPQPFRYLVAKLIARRRAPMAKDIYERLGGRSPILEETQAQAGALEKLLNTNSSGQTFKVVIAMRYWMPRSDAAALELKQWGADEIVLLPLYPQFSTATTASSLADWERATRDWDLKANTRAVCCWPTEPGLIESHAARIATVLRRNPTLRVLFSAHGLPEKIVKAGDPYPAQVERTVAAVVAELSRQGLASLDWRICYQSRVGPLKWIGPSTDDEIRRAGAEHKGLVVVPIAFVSEHSETLVELDQDYRKLAHGAGVPRYERTATPSADPVFIAGLATLVHSSLDNTASIATRAGETRCMPSAGCPLANLS